jgi:alpha-glucoside transport system permease protein
VLCLLWLVPAVGLVVTSLRTNVDVASSGWWTVFVNPRLTIDNYIESLQRLDVGTSLLYSLAIAVPTTVVVLLLSAYAAYAFAWMSFRGRRTLFLVVVALLVVPPQVTLAPMLRLFTDLGFSGTVPAVWVFQVGLSLPFGIFVLRNAFSGIPREILESAQMDGASQLTTFLRIVLPVSMPALVAVGILQFLWAWNDLLSPLIFLGANSGDAPVTVEIAGMVQSTGTGENLLVASAVLAVLVPLTVFVVLQRYFVKGALEGSVKG